MKTYKWGAPRKANPSTDFKTECKCKLCKTKFTVSHTENLIKLEARIHKGKERKREKTGMCSSNNYRRNKYKLTTIYRSVCPNCGKKKTLFRVDPIQKTFVYSEWKRFIRLRGAEFGIE